MAFNLNARSIALNGIGFGARAVAVFGFKWFSVDIEVVTDYGGGGFYEHLPRKFIVVKVKYKEKEWVARQEVSHLGDAHLETIIATFKRIQSITEGVVATFAKYWTKVPTVFTRKK